MGRGKFPRKLSFILSAITDVIKTVKPATLNAYYGGIESRSKSGHGEMNAHDCTVAARLYCLNIVYDACAKAQCLFCIRAANLPASQACHRTKHRFAVGYEPINEDR